MLEKYFSLEGNVGMVTGASRGLGRAMAAGLAEAGADVVLIGRDNKSLSETARRIETIGRQPLVVEADINRSEDVKDAVDKALSRFGKISILINNAGISGPMKLFSEYTEDEWMAVFKTNLHGNLYCTKHVAAHMIGTGGGRIIHIASVLGTIGTYFSCAYSMSKAALIQMTRNLALEWARHDIHVNAIAPGAFETEMIKDQVAHPKTKETLLKNIPLRRLGNPDEIVGLAILLSSPAASYITGTVFAVDGGFASSKM